MWYSSINKYLTDTNISVKKRNIKQIAFVLAYYSYYVILYNTSKYMVLIVECKEEEYETEYIFVLNEMQRMIMASIYCSKLRLSF